uniref:EGF-like domain-containing protein n=1 Tax=Anopheles atroparvus TaxID=41427 RepID=A0A182IST0_ANOAO
MMVPCSLASHYNDDMRIGSQYVYELVCLENEVLQETMPCCEPTCDHDCSNVKCAEVYVRQPTCVCKPGYVRHKGKCIPKSNCPPKPPTPPTCGDNEELLPSPPCCEPTCTDDCSDCACRARYVDQPTCVCKKGYRRHNGKCIRVDQCPSCGPYATLASCAPCCEPTCENDCSNVLCIAACQGDPVCVCQQGYVKHNGTCVKRELCPPKSFQLKQYCRCRGRKKQPTVAPTVPVVYQYPPTGAPPTIPPLCDYCKLPEPSKPVYYQHPPTYPPAKYGPPATYSPPTAPPPTCVPPSPPPPPVYYTRSVYTMPTAPPPCPYAPTTPKPYYQQHQQHKQQQLPSSYQDQPYYAIPALQRCACGASTPTACPSCAGGYGQPVRQYNMPPISYNVVTPASCTATAPPPTAPPATSCPNVPQMVYNVPHPAPYQPQSYYGQPHQDQPYVKQPVTSAPKPIDVTYIALPVGTTTPAPTMMCFGGV